MIRKVRVAPRASRDFDHILGYLREQSPSAAERFSTRFFDILSGLADFPFTSRTTDDPRIRYVNTHPFPYQIFLRRRGEDIDVRRHPPRRPSSPRHAGTTALMTL